MQKPEFRMALALILSVLVIFLFSYFQQPEEIEFDQQQEPEQVETVEQPEQPEPTEPLETVDLEPVEADTIPFQFKDLVGRFNLAGAELEAVKLPDYPLIESPDQPFNLVHHRGRGLLLETAFPRPTLSRTIYNSEKSESQKLYRFFQQTDEALDIEKSYQFYPDQPYRATLRIQLTNRGEEKTQLNSIDFPGGVAGRGAFALRWGPGFGLDGTEATRFDANYVYYAQDHDMSYFSPEGGGFWQLFGGGGERKYEFARGPINWLGITNRYFIAAIIPQTPFNMIYMERNPDDPELFTTWAGYGELALGPGETSSYSFELYLGPKKYEVLAETAEGLQGTMNFGWFTFLSLPLLYILNFIYNIIPNYGIAIILLSILIKLILHPLTSKGLKSMQKMKEIQPKMNKLREKYKEDKEKLNQKMMELYQKEGVNPVGGCLPLLLQMPIFIALYRTLQYSIELRGAGFFLWITDLSAHDPYYVLPVIMGITMFFQQSLQQPAGGPGGQQQFLKYIMPVVFVFIFMNFPAGLVLYWMTNSLATVFQHYLINRQLAK